MLYYNICYCFEYYDLWFDNGFFFYGMLLILNSLLVFYFCKKYVFFISDNYFVVLQYNYNWWDILFILLIEGNDFNFFSELFMLCLLVNLMLEELKIFLY